MKTVLYKKSETGPSLGSEETQTERQREEDTFAPFDGKRVRLKYLSKSEWFTTTGDSIGRIKKDMKSGQFRFYEGRARSRYRNLTLGFFEGWFATVVVTEIEAI